MRRIGVGVAVIISVLGIIWLGYQFHQEEKSATQDAKINEKMQQELNALNVREREIEEALNDMEAEKAELIQAKGSTVLLFADMDKQIYKKIYPVMQEYRYKGVLLVSEEAYPGAEQCMTKEQFDELIGAGWEYCLCWNGDKEVSKWQERQEKLLESLGLDAADAVYFPKGTYKKSYDEELKKAGYKTIAHCGEDGRELIETETSGTPWYPGTYGMNESQPRFQLEDAMEQGGTIVFRVGFKAEEDQYDENTFFAMLKRMDSYQDEQKLQVLAFSEALSFQKNLTKKRIEAETSMGDDVELLQQELAEIQQQKKAVYEKYFNGDTEVGKSAD